MKEITLILRFVVIGFIYVILFRLTKIMLKDMKVKINTGGTLEFALEVTDSPDLSGILPGTIYPLTETMSIGRNDTNGIAINDPFISGKHAEIFIDDEKYYLRDLGSTNGTLLNSQRIEDSTEIIDGDILEIGRVTFKVIG